MPRYYHGPHGPRVELADVTYHGPHGPVISAPPASDITLSLVSSSESVYQSAVTVTEIILNLISSSESVYQPRLSIAGVDLNLVSSSESIFSPTLAPIGARFRVSTFDCPAATGNVSYSGLPFTPKGVIFFLTHVTADDTETSDSAIAFGLTDFTNTVSIGTWAQDGVATTNSQYHNNQGEVRLRNSSGDTVIFTVVSAEADGFTLNYSTVTSGVKINAYILGGDQNVVVGTVSSEFGVTQHVISGLGLTPKVGVLLAHPVDPADETQPDHNLSIGFSDGTNQGAYAMRGDHGLAVSDKISILYNDRAAAEIKMPGGYWFTATFDSFVSGGATINKSAGDWNTFHYLLTDVDGEDAWVGEFDLPTSTSVDWSVTAPSIGGKSSLQLWSSHDAYGSREESGEYFSFAFVAVGEGSSGETTRSISIASADAQSTTIEDCWQADGVYLERRNGASDTTGFDIDAISLTASGFKAAAADINTIDAAWVSTARKGFGIVLGTAAFVDISFEPVGSDTIYQLSSELFQFRPALTDSSETIFEALIEILPVDFNFNRIDTAETVYQHAIGVGVSGLTLYRVESEESIGVIIQEVVYGSGWGMGLYGIAIDEGAAAQGITPLYTESSDSVYGPSVGIADYGMTLDFVASLEVLDDFTLWPEGSTHLYFIPSSETIWGPSIVGPQDLVLDTVASRDMIYPLLLPEEGYILLSRVESTDLINRSQLSFPWSDDTATAGVWYDDADSGGAWGDAS